MSETDAANETGERDVNTVWFISRAQPTPKGLVELRSGTVEMLSSKLADVQQNWGTINQQIILILESSEAQSAKTGFKLDEVSVAIGVTAKGQLAFVAEAGITATFTLTFRRK